MILCVLLFLGLITLEAKLRPFSTLPAAILAAILTWRHQAQDPEFKNPFPRVLIYGSIIAGILGELVAEFSTGIRSEGFIWRVLVPAIIGAAFALLAFIQTWGAITLARLVLEHW